MTPRSILLLAALASLAPIAAAQDVACPCATPMLRAGLFNAVGGIDTSYRAERITALSTALPQLAADEGLDVLCVGELWDPTVRAEALQGFLSDPDWTVYHPASVDLPGCQSACYNRPIDFENNPMNIYLRMCSFTTVPGTDYRCVDLGDSLAYRECVNSFCPAFQGYANTHNPQCLNCTEDDADPAESLSQRVDRCTLSYNATSADACRNPYGGKAGVTLLAKYPFLETDYLELSEPAGYQRGLANRGVAYARIETASGPAHLFCANLVSSTSGMDLGVAEPLNADQSQEVLDYIAAKSNGEAVLLLSGTGNGPELVSSPAGPVNAEWPLNFAALEAELADALAENLDASSQGDSAETCTYGCADPGSARYVDHILSAGQAVTPNGYDTDLCHRNGAVFFTTDIVSTGDGLKPLSDHLGVRTDVCLNESVDLVCNVDGDGDIDKVDLALISRQRNKTVPPLDPAYDATGDGKVNIKDVQACMRLCTRPRCATQ